tara:strand:+ start:408 stop:4415 length:4008 start_codon:yes stop_codon:yes gene_type:complete
MLRFRGGSALSSFRLKKLLDEIKILVPQVSHIFAEYWHFCEEARSLGENDTIILEKLLTYGTAVQKNKVTYGELLLVLPRPGTISTWSSKATDIAHQCGLDAVQRLERGVAFYIQSSLGELTVKDRSLLLPFIHDRMTESIFGTFNEARNLFRKIDPVPLGIIDIQAGALGALQHANNEMGLALSPDEIKYILDYYLRVGRNPTDVELMMFAQANSEHCRHKIFNADWMIDGKQQSKSLFSMIRNTYDSNPQGTVVAYTDNSSIIEGSKIARFYPDKDNCYAYAMEQTHILMKVETHNHPTAISPYSGAATGAGGEIRDEGATGRGSKPRAGLTGFSVSNLNIPGFIQSWERDEKLGVTGSYGKPSRISSSLQIMLEGPIGAAEYNNEFGRPNLAGYFRTFEELVRDEMRGYHKPIMLAGGIGHISSHHSLKEGLPPGALMIQLGGPGMLIGLGGGAASSMDTGDNEEDLDFNSVQRGNAEMERRAQEVINRCWQIERNGQANPILSIHDVGAGGLSNALPELLNDSKRGGNIELRKIPLEEHGMSPMQIWSNEAQERYVLSILPESLELFREICNRERCPFSVVGEAISNEKLSVKDSVFGNYPVEMEISVLLGKLPKMIREVTHIKRLLVPFITSELDLKVCVDKVLRLPVVSDKTFLISIGDRTVGGVTARDQMVGPWQIPVADVAVTSMGYQTYQGEAFALGEKAPLSLINAASAARMAVGEAVTNIAATLIENIEEIKLSANWMAAAGHPGEDADLFDAVQAIGMELCPQLGISIPVGKDSMSMKTVWEDESDNNYCGQKKEVIAPLSLIISSFAKVTDVRKTLTPQLQTDCGKTELILIDLGAGRNRMGGSALAQVYKQIGEQAPDLVGSDDIQKLKGFFSIIQLLNKENKILAYHDRSDGGLFATLCEMSFSGHVGISVNLDQICSDVFIKGLGESELKEKMLSGRSLEQIVPVLFNEELGAVIQIRTKDHDYFMEAISGVGLRDISFVIGCLNSNDEIRLMLKKELVFIESRTVLHRAWSETTYEMQKIRDNPVCAQQEYDIKLDASDPGIQVKLSFDKENDISAPYVEKGVRPKIAILREQGVNGHVEMAAAFDRAGFLAQDVHMSDIIEKRTSLKDYKGMAVCGGFSYGDVLGAGEGWAKSILFNSYVREEFSMFFERTDTFALGVCNGCQMLSNLHDLIPGAENWPHFIRNKSEQFEARFISVEIQETSSLFFDGMAGSIMPIVASHGEGYADFKNKERFEETQPLVTMRFVDNYGNPTEVYPFNPNGSLMGVAGMTTPDGRFTILMPHPERVFRASQNSWHPKDWQEDAPWIRIFRNARKWVG